MDLMNLRYYNDKSREHLFFCPNFLVNRQKSPFPLNGGTSPCTWWVFSEVGVNLEYKPRSSADLHHQTHRPGHVCRDFSQQFFRASCTSPLHLPSSQKYVPTYVIVTPQKPFGIICLLYKDTAFVESSPWTVGKGEVGCDLSISDCKLVAARAPTSFAAGTMRVSG